MSGRPTLTVGVTYHNEGDALRRCLESLLSEAQRPDEILVYDDASTLPVAGHLPVGPIRVIRGEVRRGPGHGRNRLARESRSDYIHFHDADDDFLPGWCRAVRALLADGSPDAVFTEVRCLHEDGRITDRTVELAQLERDPDLLRFCIRHPIITISGTFRRELFLRAGGYPEHLRLSEDYEFHIRLAALGATYRVAPEPLVLYRRHPMNRSADLVKVWSDALEILASFDGKLPIGYRKDLAEAAADLGSRLYRAVGFPEARRGFALARRFGPPAWKDRPALYRWLAARFGQEAAEGIGRIYRGCLPAALRRQISGRG